MQGERRFAPDLTLTTLKTLALRLQQDERIVFNRDQVLTYFADALPDGGQATVFLDEVLTRTGLIRRMSRTSYAFAHLTIQEFLAAQAIEGIARPEILARASDGTRSLIYLGIPGGLPTSVGRRTARALDAIPGRGSLLGGGVYRLTTLLPTDWVYLPLVLNGYAP